MAKSSLSLESTVAKLLLESKKVKGEIDTYVINPTKVFEDKESGIKRYEVLPKRGHVPPKEKVIMVLGGTGSGKSTFINGMVNYVLGVKWEDNYRFKLIAESTGKTQAKSQTTTITSYTINYPVKYQEDLEPYTVTLVDTPGFGDTEGIGKDRNIIDLIRKFFKEKGIDKLDAIGFVVQSSLARLTPTQTYIFDQVLSLFGNDIKDNIIMLLTFADGSKPLVLDAIKEAKIPYKKHFKFNNSALYISNIIDSDKSEDEEDGSCSNLQSLSWKMGTTSFKSLMKVIGSMDSKSLTLTSEVLRERNNLETKLDTLQGDIRLGTNKLEMLVKEIQVLMDHEADVAKNEDFTYNVEEEKIITQQLKKGEHVTNCLDCNITCHYPCVIPEDADKSRCGAMSGGNCNQCVGLCHWTRHRNMQYRYIIRRETVTKTYEDIQKRYQDAKGKTLSAETLVVKVKEEFVEKQKQLLDICQGIRVVLKRLDEIALKSNPISVADYIDMLIINEESGNQPGKLDRLTQLKGLKAKATTMKEIMDDTFDPFKDVEERIKQKGGAFAGIKRFLVNIKVQIIGTNEVEIVKKEQ